MEHIPVLLQPVLDHILDMDPSPRFGLDVTFGRGGHASAIMEKLPELKLLGVDQDIQAIEFGQKNFANLNELSLLHESFHNMEAIEDWAQSNWGQSQFDFILADLGVSSPQLDQAERGFSFYHDGPLDMRMNQSQELSAKDILNDWDKDDLLEIFTELGEVRRPNKVVAAIVNDRKEKPFESTLQLSQMIERVEGWQRKGHHPATKYFMALRLVVNNEIKGIEEVMPKLIKALSPEGRLLVITFHSIEDRIVKWAMKNSELGKLVNKKVIQATWDEKKSNSRARSAKLRVFEKAI